MKIIYYYQILKRMRKIVKNILVFACLIVIVTLPLLVSAGSEAFNNLEAVGAGESLGGSAAPYQPIGQNNDLASIVGIVIQAFLGILGVLFLVYMLYAGYNWLIAQGDEEKVTKAKDTIRRAIIGLIITIGAYAISFWVFDRLLLTTGIIK